jgi:hypothetical protein
MQYQTLLPVLISIVLVKGIGNLDDKEALNWAGESRIRASYDQEIN